MRPVEAAIAVTLQNLFMRRLGVDQADPDAMYYLRMAFRKAFPTSSWPTNWGSWPTPKASAPVAEAA